MVWRYFIIVTSLKIFVYFQTSSMEGDIISDEGRERPWPHVNGGYVIKYK